jgi:hypothetical protein
MVGVCRMERADVVILPTQLFQCFLSRGRESGGEDSRWCGELRCRHKWRTVIERLFSINFDHVGFGLKQFSSKDMKLRRQFGRRPFSPLCSGLFYIPMTATTGWQDTERLILSLAYLLKQSSWRLLRISFGKVRVLSTRVGQT